MLIVDKPAGPTSHDVVAIVRRTMGIRSVGHTGTLDPFATGLLVILLGWEGIEQVRDVGDVGGGQVAAHQPGQVAAHRQA